MLYCLVKAYEWGVCCNKRLPLLLLGGSYAIMLAVGPVCLGLFRFDGGSEMGTGPLPAVPKVVRVDHHFSGEADTNIQIREFFQYTGALSTADAQTWVHNIATAMALFTVNQMVAGCSLLLTELTDLSSNTAPQVIDTTSGTGTNGTVPLAEGTALVMRHKIARRYRGGHPRVYLPGQPANQLQSNGLWTPGSLSSNTSAYNTYIAAATANTNPVAIGTITHVAVSYFQHFTNVLFPSGRMHAVPTPRATPLVDLIISVQANPVPASQRRRNKQSS